MQPQPIQSMLGNLAHGFLFAHTIHELDNRSGEALTITVAGLDGRETVTNVAAAIPGPIADVSVHEYHMVSILSNQTYIGKFQVTQDQRFVRMTDVYYLAPNENNARDLRLIKSGQEIHAPQDQMTINMAYVILWQRLKDDAPLVQAILASKQPS